MSMEIGRRDAVRTAGGLAVAVAGAAGLSACGNESKTSGDPVRVNKSEVPVGSGIVSGTFVIVQPSAGDFKAFSAVCPHQGCLVKTITDVDITCPCHSSKFSVEDGSFISGPKPAPLAPANLQEEGEELVVSGT